MARATRSLAGSVVAITGGARGIGRATAAALIAQGARVAIGDIDLALADATAAELGADTLGWALDVTDAVGFERFLSAVEARLGPLDVLINNAGIMPVGPFVTETESTARRIVEINLLGVVTGSKLALARFLPRGRGHVVNIASIAGKTGTPGGATYAASKHAVVGLTESLRAEHRRSGVSFSLVIPIGVNTELYSGLRQMRTARTPEPETVAAAIVEALRTGRFEVWVPRRMDAVIRFRSLLPRAVAETISRLLGSDRALTHPDHGARAAYEARMKASIAQAPSDPPGDDLPGVAGNGHADHVPLA